MTLSKNGNTEHIHAPCLRCGYGTRHRQYPINCTCTPPNRAPIFDEERVDLPRFRRRHHERRSLLLLGQPIMLFSFKDGGEWWHADPTASRWTSKNCLGRITEAKPDERTTS
jgi:hypothetical protein